MSEFVDLAPIDFDSGSSGLGDYFMTMNPAEPVMSPYSPIFSPSSVADVMSLEQAQQLTDYPSINYDLGLTPAQDVFGRPLAAPPVERTWLQSLTDPFVRTGEGLVAGASQVATGVAQGLPNVLLASLAKKMGLTTVTGNAEDPDGPKPIYIVPEAPGVPPAGSGSTSSTIIPSTVGGFDTRTILLIGGLGLAALLLLKKR